jgi:glycosyltransferase involved in cell wall biosynthesis
MLSVIIPCYNEGENLSHLFVQIKKFLKDNPKMEVVLVNNGSSDNSLKMMNTFKLENNTLEIKICNVKVNEGYGNGILRGLDCASNDVLAWTHADLQTDIMDCKKAFDIYQEQKDKTNLLVKGFRKERKMMEVLLSYGMAAVASMKLKKWLVEVNAQPKLFNKAFYEKVKENAPLDFSLDLYFHHQAKSLGKVITFPVKFLPRIAGEAKGGSGSSLKTKVKIIKRTFRFINELAKNDES